MSDRGGDKPARSWDFFVSYSKDDVDWAEWIAWQLETAGHRVLFQKWDMTVGTHWMAAMQDGINYSAHTVAVLSKAYLRSVYSQQEWQAAVAADPHGLQRKLVPVRVEDCERPGLLGQIVSFDLFNLASDAARAELLQQVETLKTRRAKPASAPTFPGSGRPVQPPPSTATTSGSTEPVFPATNLASPETAFPETAMSRNQDYLWDVFDPVTYQAHNYTLLRPDDTSVLTRMRDFFADTVSTATGDRELAGVDVGSGGNLYPALGMLPWCATIELTDHSASNYAWLVNETRAYSPVWDQYWDVLGAVPEYQAVADPRERLAARAVVSKTSVFDLPKRRWDIGTMCFVAESISTVRDEFALAVRSFAGSLRPGAPFFATFMEGSKGYEVGGRSYPAVSVYPSDVSHCLADEAVGLVVERVVDVGEGLRAGYAGMITARGRIRPR